MVYSKTFVKPPLSRRQKIGFQEQLLLNAGQKYCRMLHGEHSAILSTFIKLPFVIKIFVLSIFEWPFYTDLLYHQSPYCLDNNLRDKNISELVNQTCDPLLVQETIPRFIVLNQ